MKLRKKVGIDVQKWILITGLTLMLVPNGIAWLWGNIVVYTDSYFRIALGLENHGRTTWVIPLYLAMMPVGTAISDVLVKRAGPSWTMMTGFSLYNVSLVLSYFTVQHSMEALVVTIGAIPGLGDGLLYGLVLFTVSSLKSKYVGILLAIPTSGQSSGSLLTNEILTYYINPSNESPNLTQTGGRSETYFTQQDVIDRVPSSFLVFAGFSLATHFISFMMIISVFYKLILKKSPNNKVEEESLTSETLSTRSELCEEKSRLLANAHGKPQRCRSSNSIHNLASSKVISANRNDNGYRNRCVSFSGRYPKSSTDVNEMSSSDRNAAGVSQINPSNEGVNKEQDFKTVLSQIRPGNDGVNGKQVSKVVVSQTSSSNEGVNEEQDFETCGQNSKSNQTESSADVNEMSSTHGNSAVVSQTSPSIEDVSEEQVSKTFGQHSKSNLTDYTTLQMIKTSTFYILFLCYTSADLSFVIVQNYYKLYGQNYIRDDHFITNFNSATVVSAAIFRVLWGAMVDFLGVKNTLIIFQSSLTVIAQAWYFAPMLNKWVYMILTTLFRSLVTGLYALFGPATLAVFGKTYFARNFSVLMFLSLAVNLFGPLIIEALLGKFGWYALCLACSLVNFSGLCAVLIGFPRI